MLQQTGTFIFPLLQHEMKHIHGYGFSAARKIKNIFLIFLLVLTRRILRLLSSNAPPHPSSAHNA